MFFSKNMIFLLDMTQFWLNSSNANCVTNQEFCKWFWIFSIKEWASVALCRCLFFNNNPWNYSIYYDNSGFFFSYVYCQLWKTRGARVSFTSSASCRCQNLLTTITWVFLSLFLRIWENGCICKLPLSSRQDLMLEILSQKNKDIICCSEQILTL